LASRNQKVKTMSLVSLRPILAPLFGAAICFAVSPRPGATVKEAMTARFVGRALTVSDAKDAGRIEIVIERWSTDEELDNLRAALIEDHPGTVLPLFQKARPEAGVLLMPGVQGLGERVRQRWALPFQFARQIDTPAGRQVVVATDQHFGFGEAPASRQAVAIDQRPGSGESTRIAPSAESEFTLLDIRFGPDGQGVGKLAPAAKVAYNQAKKIFEIDNYPAQPVRLSAVKSARP
jgi:hypothetical protein